MVLSRRRTHCRYRYQCVATGRFLSLACVASVSCRRMEDEEANIGGLGEEDVDHADNDQRISIEGEHLDIPENTITQRNSFNTQSSFVDIKREVHWEVQLRRHQQNQVEKWKLHVFTLFQFDPFIFLFYPFQPRFPIKTSGKSWRPPTLMCWSN